MVAQDELSRVRKQIGLTIEAVGGDTRLTPDQREATIDLLLAGEHVANGGSGDIRAHARCLAALCVYLGRNQGHAQTRAEAAIAAHKAACPMSAVSERAALAWRFRWPLATIAAAAVASPTAAPWVERLVDILGKVLS